MATQGLGLFLSIIFLRISIKLMESRLETITKDLTFEQQGVFFKGDKSLRPLLLTWESFHIKKKEKIKIVDKAHG